MDEVSGGLGNLFELAAPMVGHPHPGIGHAKSEVGGRAQVATLVYLYLYRHGIANSMYRSSLWREHLN